MILLNPYQGSASGSISASGFTGGYSYSAISWLAQIHQALSEL